MVSAAHSPPAICPPTRSWPRGWRVARSTPWVGYAVLGLQAELSPLVNVFVSVIQNLHDASRYLQLRGVYDWRQDTQFMAGFNLPDGERGSEYGGLPTGLPDTWLAPGRSFYLRAAFFF